MSEAKSRVVVLVDMDCFYVQVEQRMNPMIQGKPCAVVQYNDWKGGGIIAVGYEARSVGVTRNMRGDDAKLKCPEIHLCRVPTANGKADLTRYRDASAEVIKVLLQFGGLVERASIDEAYIDFTDVVDDIIQKSTSVSDFLPDQEQLPNTHIVGYPLDKEHPDLRSSGLLEFMDVAKSEASQFNLRLIIGAKLAEEMRKSVFEQTTFRCSAGISHNKMLAKLACGINKPNKQTILPMTSVADFFKTIKISKIRNLGGKLGKSLTELFGIQFIGELSDISREILIEKFGHKTGIWLNEVCRGIDHEVVKERHLAESIGCSKNFTGNNALNTRSKVNHWMKQLAKELVERLVKERDLNNRLASGVTINVGVKGRHISRVSPLSNYDVDEITTNSMTTLEQLNESRDRSEDIWNPPITMMGLSVKNLRSLNGDDTVTSRKRNSINKFAVSSSIIREQIEKNELNLSPASMRGEKRKISSLDSFVGSKLSPKQLLLQSSSSNTKLNTGKDIFSKFAYKPKNEPIKSSHEKEEIIKLDLITPLQDSSTTRVVKSSPFFKSSPINPDKKKVPFFQQKKLELGINPQPLKEVKTETEVIQSATHKPLSTKNYEAPLIRKDEIDMSVFQSLPLSIQHELKVAFGLESSNQKSKDVKKNNTIDKFLAPGIEPNFQSSSSQNINNKGLFPFGYRRERAEASKAIIKAIEAQKVRNEKSQKTTFSNK